jgi:hypothetical protein
MLNKKYDLIFSVLHLNTFPIEEFEFHPPTIAKHAKNEKSCDAIQHKPT